jgi:hypothetical protein
MSRSEAKTASSDHLAIAILLLLAAISIPGMALAADDACAGISQKCTTDTTYDKTIGGTVYSCYDCKQALCKDGGNGGLSGTKTSSVCTEKATIFQPLSQDGKFGGAGDQHLAPEPKPQATPGGKRRLRSEAANPQAVPTPAVRDQGKRRRNSRNPGKEDSNGDDADRENRAPAGDTTHFDEADALFGPRTQVPAVKKKVQTTSAEPAQPDVSLHPMAPSPIPVPYPNQP